MWEGVCSGVEASQGGRSQPFPWRTGAETCRGTAGILGTTQVGDRELPGEEPPACRRLSPARLSLSGAGLSAQDRPAVLPGDKGHGSGGCC